MCRHCSSSKLASSDLPAATAAGKGPITTPGTLTLICKLLTTPPRTAFEFFETTSPSG